MAAIKMRKTSKIMHTIAASGLIGGLACYMILLMNAPEMTPAAYADLRQSLLVVSNYILLPSLAIALISGLFSMVVHKPFLDKGWVWIKALLGILMFKGTLTIISAKADYAAKMSAEIAAGTAPADALDSLYALEWGTLWLVLAIAVANVVLGVWRPRVMPAQPVKAAAREPAHQPTTPPTSAPNPALQSAPGAQGSAAFPAQAAE